MLVPLLLVLLKSKLIVLGLTVTIACVLCATFLEVYIQAFVHEPWMKNYSGGGGSGSHSGIATDSNDDIYDDLSLWETIYSNFTNTDDGSDYRAGKRTKKTRRRSKTRDNVTEASTTPVVNVVEPSAVVSEPVVADAPVASVPLGTGTKTETYHYDEVEYELSEEDEAIPLELATHRRMQSKAEKQQTNTEAAVPAASKMLTIRAVGSKASNALHKAAVVDDSSKGNNENVYVIQHDATRMTVRTRDLIKAAVSLQPIRVSVASHGDYRSFLDILKNIFYYARDKLRLPAEPRRRLSSMITTIKERISINNMEARVHQLTGEWNALVQDMRTKSYSMEWDAYIRMNKTVELNSHFMTEAQAMKSEYVPIADLFRNPERLDVATRRQKYAELAVVDFSHIQGTSSVVLKKLRESVAILGYPNFELPIINFTFEHDQMAGTQGFHSQLEYETAFFCIVYNALAVENNRMFARDGDYIYDRKKKS